MDITALWAASTPPDASGTSAETSTGASDAFAALLDEAAGATSEACEYSSAPDANSVDEDETFDELAAMAMPSLLSLDTPIATPSVPDEDANADGGEVTGDVALADATSQLARTDVDVQAELAPVGMDGSEESAAEASNTRVPSTWNENARTTTATDDDAEPEAAAAAVVTTPTVGEGDSTTEASGDGRASVEIEAASRKPHPASKPARTANGKHAPVQAVQDLEAQATAAAKPGLSMPEIQATGSERSAVDTPMAPASTAARFARALERAAAMATGDAASSAAVAATANTGGGEQSALGDGSNARTQQPFAAGKHASGSLSVTVAAPTSFDVRTLARAVDAASQTLETTPGNIPERDVVAQLVQSMRMQFRDGIGEAVVKLKPEHLGSVQISLKIENGAIKATVQAEVPAVRQWLESQQDTLRTSLADQGLRLERFVVEPDGERQQSAGEDAQQREHRRRQQQRRMSGTHQPVFEVTV